MSIVRIKKVNVLKWGCILGIIYSILGVVVSIPMMFTMGIWAIFVFPFMYGVIGMLGGLLTSWLYNVVSKWIGGMVVEVETLEKFSE